MTKKTQKITVSDPTLRDGSHAISHQMDLEYIRQYAKAADQAGVNIIEVGHGNGLGASSVQLGFAKYSDYDMLKTVRLAVKNNKIGVHIIPGFGVIDRDLAMAVDKGVDVVRVASHCTEANITKRHIDYAARAGCDVFGVLMMSHMASKERLLTEATKMQDYGAHGIILMDSAGTYMMNEVHTKVEYLVDNLKIDVGFHAHNNLGLAIANSLIAIDAGATIIDGTACGFGAGSGNAAIEVLVATMSRLKIKTQIDLDKLLDAVEIARDLFIKTTPHISTLSLVSGLTGIFSGFIKPVKKAAIDFDVCPREIFYELSKQKILAGQEDLIIAAAQSLARQKSRRS